MGAPMATHRSSCPPSLPVLALGVTAASIAIGIAIVSGCGSGAAGGFGNHGKVLTPMLEADGADAFAIQADGRIVAVGGPFDVARYTRTGRLDPSFGRGGKVTRGWGSRSAKRSYGASAIAIQHDGKLVLGGSVGGFWGGNEEWDDFALARYTPTGRLDPSFGNGGRVESHFGRVHSVHRIYALAIQRDGKIIASGTTLARYTRSGRLDPNFGSGGKLAGEKVQGGSVNLTALAIQRDGKIVAAGEWHNGADSRFVVARYTSDGKLDRGFGRGGVVWPGFVSGLVIQRDSKIVAGGKAVGSSFALSRYTPSGRLDPNFGSNGEARTPFPGLGTASAVAIQANGRVVVAGATSSDRGTGSFVVVRYTEDGQLDVGFGKGGSVKTKFGPLPHVSGVSIQRDGKIVAVGGGGNGVLPGTSFALVRYTRDGRLDS